MVKLARKIRPSSHWAKRSCILTLARLGWNEKMNLRRLGMACGLLSTASHTLGSAIRYARALADSACVPQWSLPFLPEDLATVSSSQSTTAPPPAETIADRRPSFAATISATNAATRSSNSFCTSWFADDMTDARDFQRTPAAAPVCFIRPTTRPRESLDLSSAASRSPRSSSARRFNCSWEEVE